MISIKRVFIVLTLTSFCIAKDFKVKVPENPNIIKILNEVRRTELIERGDFFFIDSFERAFRVHDDKSVVENHVVSLFPFFGVEGSLVLGNDLEILFLDLRNIMVYDYASSVASGKDILFYILRYHYFENNVDSKSKLIGELISKKHFDKIIKATSELCSKGVLVEGTCSNYSVKTNSKGDLEESSIAYSYLINEFIFNETGIEVRDQYIPSLSFGIGNFLIKTPSHWGDKKLSVSELAAELIKRHFIQ